MVYWRFYFPLWFKKVMIVMLHLYFGCKSLQIILNMQIIWQENNIYPFKMFECWLIKCLFDNNVFFSYALLCSLISDGVRPMFFLKHRLKYLGSENPQR